MDLPVTGQTCSPSLHSALPLQSEQLSIFSFVHSAQFGSVQDESLMFAPEARQATPRHARPRTSISFFIDQAPLESGSGRRGGRVRMDTGEEIPSPGRHGKLAPGRLDGSDYGNHARTAVPRREKPN